MEWTETDNPLRVKVTAKLGSADIEVELNWNAAFYVLTEFVNGSDPQYFTEDAVNLLRARAQQIQDAIDMRDGNV